MSYGSPYGDLVAAAAVDAAGAYVGVPFGFAPTPAPVPIAGVFTLTLEPDIDDTDAEVLVTCTGATAATASAGAIVADNTVAVSTFTAANPGAATAFGFHIKIFRKAVG